MKTVLQINQDVVYVLDALGLEPGERKDKNKRNHRQAYQY
jgi:hypothetical protein